MLHFNGNSLTNWPVEFGISIVRFLSGSLIDELLAGFESCSATRDLRLDTLPSLASVRSGALTWHEGTVFVGASFEGGRLVFCRPQERDARVIEVEAVGFPAQRPLHWYVDHATGLPT